MQGSRTRTLVEVGIAIVVLAAVFTWSEGLLSDKVRPGDVVHAATVEPPAETAVARAEWVPVVTEALGTVRPATDASLAARVLGVVKRVRVDEGDRVAAGDVLVEIDAGELGARGAAARRRVEVAEAQLAQARRELARSQALQEKEAATAVEVERAESSVEVAEAALAAARQGAVGEATMASYTVLRAPFDGRVAGRHVDPGDLATPGLVLLDLEAEGRFRLEAPVDERLGSRLAPGEPVEVAVDALGETLAASVAEVEPTADAASRTLLVKLDLPDRPGLRTGLFGRARLVVGRRSGVSVPLAAVQRVGGLATVRVVGQERAVTRHVRLGSELGADRVEILSGVAAGERVALPARGGAR
jgi:RND family efflux transporter MFP subunit